MKSITQADAAARQIADKCDREANEFAKKCFSFKAAAEISLNCEHVFEPAPDLQSPVALYSLCSKCRVLIMTMKDPQSMSSSELFNIVFQTLMHNAPRGG